MFLAIGKAIYLSKIASSLSDHHVEFLADLGRWQVLFRSDEWSLSTFRNAISDIWHVSAEALDRVQPPYATSLIQFQELAMGLITNVEQSFHCQRDLDKGLLASQKDGARTEGQKCLKHRDLSHLIYNFPKILSNEGDLPSLIYPNLQYLEERTSLKVLKRRFRLEMPCKRIRNFGLTTRQSFCL